MKTDYNERKENKISRFKELAAKNEQASEQQFKRAQELSSFIPMGQPILIGHHSEKRDRNFRNKIHSIQDKAMESMSKAEYYEQRAAIAESNTAISSDDPEAIAKLTDKLDAMIHLQDVMKACNKILKSKKLSTQTMIEELVNKLGFNSDKATKIVMENESSRIKGLPAYKLTNNNANISRVKKRIEQLSKISAMESIEVEVNDVKIVTNVEGNRIQIFFPGKPEEKVREQLKSHGFRWAPTEKAWQRQISNSSSYWAKEIVSGMNVNEAQPEELENSNGPTGHGDDSYSDADPGL